MVVPGRPPTPGAATREPVAARPKPPEIRAIVESFIMTPSQRFDRTPRLGRRWCPRHPHRGWSGVRLRDDSARRRWRYRERMDASFDRDHVVRAVDVIAVVLLGAMTAASVVAAADGFWWRFLAVLAGAGISLPLLARRTWPLPVAVVVVGMIAFTAWVFGYGSGGGAPWLCVVLATYAVGAFAEPG